MAIENELLTSTAGRKRRREETDGGDSEGSESYGSAKGKSLAVGKPAHASTFNMSDTSLSDPDETEAEEEEDEGNDVSASKNAGLKGDSASSDEEEGYTVVPDGVAAVECLWDACGKLFTELNNLIDHLHNRHIGTHKAKYTCEWAGCPRKGKSQTSRFALISHLRSHTGEKPFTCPLPECDKSFTRSDALAKHMRVQHSMVPSLARRGKPRRIARNSNTLGKTKGAGDDGEDEEPVEDTEMVTLSDYEPVDKPAEPAFHTFTDEALGIVRESFDDPAEENEIQAVRVKAAEILKCDFGIGSAIDPDDGSDVDDGESDAALLAAAASTEELYQNRRTSKRGKPNPMDLINNSGTQSPGATSAMANGSTASYRSERPDMLYKKLYLIEKAKLKFLQAENAEIRKEVKELKDEEIRVTASKTEALERVLTLELGQDVDAIFSPPVTPPPTTTFTELRGPAQ